MPSPRPAVVPRSEAELDLMKYRQNKLDMMEGRQPTYEEPGVPKEVPKEVPKRVPTLEEWTGASFR